MARGKKSKLNEKDAMGPEQKPEKKRRGRRKKEEVYVPGPVMEIAMADAQIINDLRYENARLQGQVDLLRDILREQMTVDVVLDPESSRKLHRTLTR